MRYILDGHEPKHVDDLNEWGNWFATSDRTIAQEQIRDACVSTVFIALDHRVGEGPPLLFETLVFGGALDGELWRYSTWEEAEHGHAIMVDRVRAA